MNYCIPICFIYVCVHLHMVTFLLKCLGLLSQDTTVLTLLQTVFLGLKARVNGMYGTTANLNLVFSICIPPLQKYFFNFFFNFIFAAAFFFFFFVHFPVFIIVQQMDNEKQGENARKNIAQNKYLPHGIFLLKLGFQRISFHLPFEPLHVSNCFFQHHLLQHSSSKFAQIYRSTLSFFLFSKHEVILEIVSKLTINIYILSHNKNLGICVDIIDGKQCRNFCCLVTCSTL